MYFIMQKVSKLQCEELNIMERWKGVQFLNLGALCTTGYLR